MKSNKILKLSFVAALMLIMSGVLTSCNDFVERNPLDQVSPDQFFGTEGDVASYPINYYNSVFLNHGNTGGWSTGTGRLDDGTDNQASTDPNRSAFEPGVWLVPSSGNFGMGVIRASNWFFENVLPKWKANSIKGTPANIDHYIGEVYMIRAAAYFSKLQRYGDFPIITKTLPDQEQILVENAPRAPRNKVARFILADLDSAILLMQSNAFNKTRLTKEAALVLKSRVALFEASYLKYHQGTPRVPGSAEWPGAKMAYNQGFSININEEINFFLDQAMSASKQVAEAVALSTKSTAQMDPNVGQGSGWNPYFEMFGDRNMAKYPEILFWRQFSLTYNLGHTVSLNLKRGGNTGLTKGMVESFLMKNGLPIYATGSGYHGDVTLVNVKKDRDPRLQLFLFDESTVTYYDPLQRFGAPQLLNNPETRDVTGYRSRKYLNYDPSETANNGPNCTGGSPIFRVEEAYLNYIEASYLKTSSIDATADKYWKALRERIGMDTDYTKTINATDMREETNDWGAYSGAAQVDATMYNIRRERRVELASEGFRWEDLKRWRSLDHVKNYQIEGFNLWDEAYKLAPIMKEGTADGNLVSDGTADANVSSKDLSKYLRPYQKLKGAANTMWNGYTWSEAYYLHPVPYREMQLASPDGNAENSNFYQNPYWPVKPAAKAEK